ncbi:MAG TPA: D-alanine--D-alanine ligase [Candidatus Paceibacterota bacterium]|nr:D-alanine--D-alanine ligase [Candidatus Paceibacterota bacterium]
MSHRQIAVLRGGPSEEYQVSMSTGSEVLSALSRLGRRAKDITITKQGEWLDGGRARLPESILESVDLVFIALHGRYGEDGEVQKILQRLNIPFTGSRAFSSALAFNKSLTKKSLTSFDILMPDWREVTNEEDFNLEEAIADITSSFGPEYIVKPVSSGSSFGVNMVRAGEDLEPILRKALESHERVLVEEFIRGREATCATLENFRNDDIYVFPSVEIIPPRDSLYFDTTVKYNGQTMEICPARFSYGERVKLAEITALVHQALDLSQYSRSDFIINNQGVYFLEVNTLPGLTTESLYPKAAAAVGLNYDQLIVHLVETAKV